MAGLALLVLLLTVWVAGARTALTVVDMTLVLDNDTVRWAGNDPFQFDVVYRGWMQPNGTIWYETNAIASGEHLGTHVDAPSHFYQGGWRTHDIPASRLSGPAAVVDVKAKVSQDPDYQMTVDDIKAWESAHGRLPERAMVLMNSGWGSRYPNASHVFNTDQPDTPSTYHFPGVHPEAASFLTEQRDVIAVGVDTPSTDHGQSATFGTHVALGKHNVLGLENLQNLDSLPARGATVVVGLVKTRGGSGGLARILAFVGDDFPGNDTGSGSAAVAWVTLTLALAVLSRVIVGWC